jgi:CubicO group peptidase (beta-lactamase class C family)
MTAPHGTRRASTRTTAVALVVCVSLLVVGGATSVAAEPTTGRRPTPAYAKALEPKLAEQFASSKAPGGAVLVLSEKLGNWSTTYGTTTLGGKHPVSLNDHVRIASNTKTMTGTVILQLVGEGKLRVSDPISKYRADVPNGQNITIADLLDMRSGLYNYSESVELNEALDQTPERVWTPAQILAIAFAHPPYFAPGTDYHYSNTNTVLLGLVVERLTHQPLRTAFAKRIYEPLGLKNTTFPSPRDATIPDPHPQGVFYGTSVETRDDPALSPERQAAADDGTLQPTDVTDLNPSWIWAAGAAISTARDLATYVKKLVGGGLLPPKLQKQRLASVVPSTPGGAGYGLALASFGPFYGHTGEVPGFNSFMAYDPTRHITVIVWTSLVASPNGSAPAIDMAQTIIGELAQYS